MSTPQSASSSARPAPLAVDRQTLAAVAQGAHHAPHDVLGAHLQSFSGGTAVTYRVLRPLARTVTVVPDDGSDPVELHHEFGGVFVGVGAAAEDGTVRPYRVRATYLAGPQHDDGHAGESVSRAAQTPRTVEHVDDDPYRHLPTVGELDLHLIGEGRHERLWEVLGARVMHGEGGPLGTAFAVWAPNARAVRVVGDHNGWDGRLHAMRVLGSSGVWELFVPSVGHGARYKYEILGADGQWRQKADPLARWTEVPPATASRVWDSAYEFDDDAWMRERAATDPHERPLSIYEVHLGSWRPGLGYRELADQLVEYVSWLGFTHVEFLPVAEHPFGGSWGYQVTGFYAPTSRFGSPDEFKHLVDALHRAGIGVLVDWVPAHFPKDEFALGRFDGTPLYEHPDPRRGEHPDWGTYVFDYGRHEVRNFLVANALYWLEEFHIDGLRVDAVASMLYLDYSREDGQWEPNVDGGNHNLEAIAFLREVNAAAYRLNPGIHMIAEESTAFEGVSAPVDAGGLGFGKKWNMGWMHDTLAYLGEDPVNRSWHHGMWTFSMVYAYSENYVLPLSHDEVVHGKGSLLAKIPGDRWQQLATLRAYFAYMWAHPGKQLLFMGGEFGQPTEWSEGAGLDWAASWSDEHRGVQLTVRRLNELYRQTPALWSQDHSPAGFTWLEADAAADNLMAFVRHAGPAHRDGGAARRDGNGEHEGRDEAAAIGEPVDKKTADNKTAEPNSADLVCVVHLSGVARQGVRVGVPTPGRWSIVLDTDRADYGGADHRALVASGRDDDVRTEPVPWQGQPHSVVLNVPALTTLWLRPRFV